jgi:hypothetical protein
MSEDLNKLAEQVEKEGEALRKSGESEGDVPDEVKREQADLDEQLRTPLKRLDDIAEKGS